MEVFYEGLKNEIIYFLSLLLSANIVKTNHLQRLMQKISKIVMKFMEAMYLHQLEYMLNIITI